jgi:hypothetical protein
MLSIPFVAFTQEEALEKLRFLMKYFTSDLDVTREYCPNQLIGIYYR